MRPKGVFLAMFSIVLVAMLGCQADRPETMPPDEQTGAEVPPPAQQPAEPGQQQQPQQEQMVSGQLGKVDLEAQTFTVMEGDTEHEFTFSDTTQVMGAAGTQGLVGREGSRVTVHYRDELGTNMATRIELEAGQ